MSVGHEVRCLGALLIAALRICSAFGQSGYFGVSQISINPSTSIRLSGYAARDSLPESSAVQQNITAEAAAFGFGAKTAVLLTVRHGGLLYVAQN
jgi:hypothetical protein